MRAPLQSFCSVLATYRRVFIAWPAPIHLLNRPRYERAIKTLERWERNYDDAEEIWSTIESKLLVKYLPNEFILDVLLSQRRAMEGGTVALELTDVERKARQRIKRHLAEKDYLTLGAEAIWFDEVREIRGRILSRKKKTAALAYFMAGWAGKLRKLCGQPLYETVALLTNIVFDRKRKITGDTVCEAEKSATHRTK
jgi:hypothetical protein